MAGQIKHIFTNPQVDVTNTNIVRPSDWNSNHAYTLPDGISAGTQLMSSGTLAFANSNGISFGMSNSSQITASYTVPSIAGLLSAVNVSAGTTSNNLSALTFANSNGISFGLNGSVVTGTVQTNYLTTAAASDHSHGNPTLALTNISGTTASASNGFTLSLSAGAGGGAVVSNAIQSVGSATNSGTNTSRFAADDHVHAGVFSFGVSTAGNTVGDTRVDVGRFVLQGGNNVTLSQITGANALNTIVISGGAAGAADGVNALVVNAGASTASTTLTLSNGNNITFGLAAGVITASASFNQTSQSAIKAFGVSNTGQTAGNTGVSSGIDWVLAGSQSITLSQSTNAGGPNTVWIQHPAWLTTAMASNRGSDFVQATAAFAGTSASGTIASNGISISIGPYITTAALSNHSHGVSFTSGSVAFQTLSFTNSNGISFNSGTQGIFASHNALTTARASTDAIGLNTAQTNVTWTVNSSGLSLNAAGYAGTGTSATNASITLNSNGLAISVAAGGGVTPVASASNGSFSFTTLGFSNANNVTFGTSAGGIITASVAAPGAAAENNWVNLLGANTAGNTTASGSTIGYSGINLTLSGTNGSVVNISAPATSSLVGTNGISISTNGSTISVSNVPVSYFSWPLAQFNGTTSLTVGGSSVFVQPFDLENPISASYIRIPVSQGFGSTSQTTGGVNGSLTFRVTHTYYVQFLTAQGGASSRSLAVAYSTTQTSCMQINATVTATNGQTVSHFFTYPVTGNSSVGFTTGANPTNASFQISTTHLTAFNGARFIDVPFATLMIPGAYWMAIQLSSATASTSGGQNYSNITAATNRNSFYAVSQVSANINEMGGNTTAGSNMWAGQGHGWWTTNTLGATTSQMNLAQISTIANQPLIPFLLIRQA